MELLKTSKEAETKHFCVLPSAAGVADTLRYLLVGSGEITLENIEVNIAVYLESSANYMWQS